MPPKRKLSAAYLYECWNARQTMTGPVAFWATVCKTVRPMLSNRCLSCLSETLVYCGQTVQWIQMKLGTEVGLGSGDIVLDGDPRQSPTSRPMSIVAKRSPISATAEHLFDLGRVSSSSNKQDRAAGLMHLTASLSPQISKVDGDGEKNFRRPVPQPHDQVSTYGSDRN